MNTKDSIRQSILMAMAPLYREHDRLIHTPEVKAFIMLTRDLTQDIRDISGISMTASVLSYSEPVKTFLAVEESIAKLVEVNNMVVEQLT